MAEITEQEKQRMNEIYFTLSTKQAQLLHGLYHRIFELSSGFYNGHERQTPDGGWQMDYYPIPVISVKGFFDVEISPDGISVTTKKKRKDALAHDVYPAQAGEWRIMGSCENVMNSFPERYRTFNPAQVRLSVGEAGGKPQVPADINMERIPLREFTGRMGELVEITRNYDKFHHRNKKKDDAHLNKHAMHLVRLYLMCLDILEKEKIVTYREADHDLLMDIRSGRYQRADHTFSAEFYDLLNELENRLDYAKETTSLPEAPDLDQIEAFQMEANERVTRDEI